MAKPQCSGTSDKLLTPAVLRQDFGSRAVVTRDAVRVFHDALVLAGRPAVERWKTLFGRWAGCAFEKIPNELAKVSRRYGIGHDCWRRRRRCYWLCKRITHCW